MAINEDPSPISEELFREWGDWFWTYTNRWNCFFMFWFFKCILVFNFFFISIACYFNYHLLNGFEALIISFSNASINNSPYEAFNSSRCQRDIDHTVASLIWVLLPYLLSLIYQGVKRWIYDNE